MQIHVPAICPCLKELQFKGVADPSICINNPSATNMLGVRVYRKLGTEDRQNIFALSLVLLFPLMALE